jgi:hypothetical protein
MEQPALGDGRLSERAYPSTAGVSIEIWLSTQDTKRDQPLVGSTYYA